MDGKDAGVQDTHLLSLLQHRVFYWREQNYEVDHAIEKGNKGVVLEVKSGRRADNEGLARFRGAFHPYRPPVIGTSGPSFNEFLSLNPGLLFK